jgi:hypothetical protein
MHIVLRHLDPVVMFFLLIVPVVLIVAISGVIQAVYDRVTVERRGAAASPPVGEGEKEVNRSLHAAVCGFLVGSPAALSACGQCLEEYYIMIWFTRRPSMSSRYAQPTHRYRMSSHDDYDDSHVSSSCIK